MTRSELIAWKARLLKSIRKGSLTFTDGAGWDPQTTKVMQSLCMLHETVCRELDDAQADDLPVSCCADLQQAESVLEQALEGGHLTSKHILHALALLRRVIREASSPGDVQADGEEGGPTP